MHQEIILSTITLLKEKTPYEVISLLFANKTLKDSFPNEIRRSTFVGMIANEIFTQLWFSYQCKILAIGDVHYFGEDKKLWEQMVQESLTSIQPDMLLGYDLSGVGSLALRQAFVKYMNVYYQFPEREDEVVEALVPCYGSTDGFSMVLWVLGEEEKKRDFVFPEASFLANLKIAETSGFRLVSLPKPSKDNFFLSKAQIRKWYQENVEKTQKVFYFTAVGNPTGEKIVGEDLYEIMQCIHTQDPEALFLLDNVYVGLLKHEVSTQMFARLFANRALLDQVIFCESLSKTFGTTGIRLWAVWSLNPRMSANLKRSITLKKAGFSKILDAFGVHFLWDLSRVEAFQESVFATIADQRSKFVDAIKTHYQDLFDFEASVWVRDREGMYVLLKLKAGESVEGVFAKTLLIGVGICLSDGWYIRYSFGNTKYF